MMKYKCPVCSNPLDLVGKSYKCLNNHTFDVAKEGYVNFALGKSDGGDNTEMCASRRRFLSGGYYEKFSHLINQTVKKYLPDARIIVDAGCGEGYYLRELRKVFSDSELFGLDLAKDAVRMAAKTEKQTDGKRNSYCVCGIFSLPFDDNTVDGVISVFAPVGDKENFRVLKNGGYMFIAGPGKTHLSGLKSAIYEKPYENPEKHREYDGFEYVGKETVEYSVCVLGDAIKDLFTMTPYYWKTSKEDASKLEMLDELETVLSFEISVYRKP